MTVFEKMCTLASDATNLREELHWLSQATQSQEIVRVKDVLKNFKPHDLILQQGQSIMDVSDFCSLACERYVNSFAIDTICLTFLKVKKQSDVVYLPCYSQTWAKQGAQYFSQKVSEYFSHCSVDSAKIILTPFHFKDAKHWGLICFDIANKTVYFDDGMKISLPRNTVAVLKNMLNGFEALSGDAKFLLHQWNSPRLGLPLPRINMPQQPSTGVGAGSCGVGVILAVKDIICTSKCLPSFQWRFAEMGYLRKQLMSQVLEWRNK